MQIPLWGVMMAEYQGRVLGIARMGRPVLRQRADPVAEPLSTEIRQLAADMIVTMEDAVGVGLAAPQVHRSLRVIVFKVPESRRTDDEPPAPDGVTVLVNPEITVVDATPVEGIEGCLSIPGLRGIVPRAKTITYRGLGLDGREIVREASGFHARVVQHEVDHLDGVLYLDRMTDLAALAFDTELSYLWAANPNAS